MFALPRGQTLSISKTTWAPSSSVIKTNCQFFIHATRLENTTVGFAANRIHAPISGAGRLRVLVLICKWSTRFIYI